MPTNDFYKGILYELEKISETTQQPNIPSPAVPNVQKPLNLGYDNGNTKWTPAVQNATKSWMQAPQNMRSDLINISQNVVGKGNLSNPAQMTGDIKNQFLKQEGLDGLGEHWYNKLEHPIKAYNAWASGKGQQAEELGQGLQQLHTPEDFTQFAQLNSAHDPQLAGAFRGAAGAQIRKSTDNASLGNIFNRAIGNGSDAEKAVTTDSQINDYANKQGLSRAGNIVGDFLSKNWKTIAMSVGGIAAFIALLKSMSNNQNNQNNMPASQAVGPRFM